MMRNWVTKEWGDNLFNSSRCLAVGMAREREGNSEQAVTLFHNSLRHEPLWAARDLNWYGLAIVKGRLGQFEEARHWLSQAEASLGSKLRLARREPNVPPGYNLHELLEARFRSLETRALLAPDALHPLSH